MYKIEVIKDKKLFVLEAEGRFELDEARACIDAYDHQVSLIDPSEYTLLIDARKQYTSTPDVGELLELIIKKYIETPFKKRYMVKLDSVIAMSQVLRLGGSKFTESFSIVKTPEELLRKL